MENLDTKSDADGIFNGKMDMFKGITIHLEKENILNSSDEEFERRLIASLDHYQQSLVRGVWIRIPILQSSFVPVAVKHGFVFHHCYPSYIVMTKWLPQDEPNGLPTFGTSYIGVGGFVVREDGKLLVVQERFRTHDHWKLPGGMANYKEDIRQTARREVLEETGIEAEFVSLICVRHFPDFRFGCSDLYFICLMTPKTTEIKPDPAEISDAKWIELDEYIDSPNVNESNKFIARSFRENFLDKDRKIKITPTDMHLYNRDAVFYSLNFPHKL